MTHPLLFDRSSMRLSAHRPSRATAWTDWASRPRPSDVRIEIQDHSRRHCSSSARLLWTPGIQKMDVDGDGGRRDLRMEDKPHQLRRLWICWSSSSNDMPRDGFASNSASRSRASAIPSSSSCRTDESDSSRCAARIALSVSGKSSASFSTSAMVAIRASLVATASKARTHQKTAT
jgi:hypothetical protein